MGSFIPCIQMDAYPYEHSPKRKVVPAPYFQLLQAVVVQYAVVDTLTGCTFAVHDNIPTYELLDRWDINALIDINGRAKSSENAPAQHVKRMAEVPCFVIAVPSP